MKVSSVKVLKMLKISETVSNHDFCILVLRAYIIAFAKYYITESC